MPDALFFEFFKVFSLYLHTLCPLLCVIMASSKVMILIEKNGRHRYEKDQDSMHDGTEGIG